MPSQFYFPEINRYWNGCTFLLQLKPSSTVRNGKVVPLDHFFKRWIFFFRESLFKDRRCQDDKEFHTFYQKIKNSIQQIEESLEKNVNLIDTIQKIVALLQIDAKIMISQWKPQNQDYLSFRKKIESLQLQAKSKVNIPALSQTVKRWIESTSDQRKFAAYCHTDLPLKWEEIPAGALILCNPKSWAIAHHIRGHTLRWDQMIKKVKALLCKLLNGTSHTHAELCLGNGYTFDLAKKHHMRFSGEGKIQDRRGRICYEDVFFPNEKKMIETHNQKFPFSQVATFEPLSKALEREARTKGILARAHLGDILKTSLPSYRPSHYDCTRAWLPEKNRCSCSALISALFGKYGVDIGKQFNKKDQNITPADFYHSEFFSPHYVLG